MKSKPIMQKMAIEHLVSPGATHVCMYIMWARTCVTVTTQVVTVVGKA